MQHDALITPRGRQWATPRILWRPLALIFVLAFVLRAAPCIYLEWREPGWHANNIEELEFYYDDVGRSLIAGKGFVHSIDPRPGCRWGFQPGTPFDYEPPLYAWWIGLVYFAFGPNIQLAIILQCLMDASVCPLLYVLARRMTGQRGTALLSALLYAVYPLAIFICGHLCYQIPMNLALIWLILCVMCPPTWRNGMWAGLAVAVSALAKPVTLPLIALLPAVKVAECLGRKITLKSCLLWCACFTAASLAALTPWTIRNWTIFHHFVAVQASGGNTMLLGSKDEYLDVDTFRAYQKMAADTLAAEQKNGESLKASPGWGWCDRSAVTNHLQHLKASPLDYARFLGKKFLMTWYNTEGKGRNLSTLLVQLPFLALAILGLFCAPRLWFTNGNWYVPAMVLYVCCVQVAYYPLLRYTLAVMPLVMVMGAVGCRWLFQRLFAMGGEQLRSAESAGQC